MVAVETNPGKIVGETSMEETKINRIEEVVVGQVCKQGAVKFSPQSP